MTEGGDQALKLQALRIFDAEAGNNPVRLASDDARIFTRIYGEAMIEIMNAEFAPFAIEPELQAAIIEDRAVMLAEHGQQHLAAQFFIERLPIDVEVTGIDGSLAILEYIKPPVVVAAQHAHVIRHDLDTLPHAAFFQRRDKPLEILA